MEKVFYTYAYLREDGSPYYIGKGKGDRAYSERRRKVGVPPKNRILFLKKNLTEEEAFRHEIYMIAVLGRKDLGTGILRNLTDGGEGFSGIVYNEETRAKMSAAKKGKKRGPHNPETKAKISAAKKGKPAPHSFSEEARAKISEANKRRVISEETREKLREAKRGKKRKPFSEEHRAKIGASVRATMTEKNKK